MTIAEVKKILGKADSEGLYALIGLAVLPDEAHPQRVGMLAVMGGGTNNGAARKDFAGATKEGIRIGSSGPEILKVFGPPDGSDVPAPGWEMMNYHALGMSVSLQDGKARGITVFKKSEKSMTYARAARPESKPAPAISTADFIVEPRVGVGPVKFGMTVAEVTQKLGKPVQINSERITITTRMA